MNVTTVTEGDWTEPALCALMKRLYLVGRKCREQGMKRPVFVLPARNLAARRQFQDVLHGYFVSQYGQLLYHCYTSENDSDTTLIHFPEFDVTVALIDV